MSAEVKSRGTRMKASERREEILEAAIREFAIRGLHGTSTETIAVRAGISQPYLFRLFGTKRDLFLCAVHRAFDRIEVILTEGMRRSPHAPLEGAGQQYIHMLLPGRDELLLQMQAYAAVADREVQEVVRGRFAQLYGLVAERSGSSEEEVRNFFAHGMLINVAAALDLGEVMDLDAWARKCMEL